MWKLWRKIRTVRFEDVDPGVVLRELNQRAVSGVQGGGSVSLTQNEAGFLRLTWSLWTAQRSQKRLNLTTKASCAPRSRHEADICVSVVWSVPAGELHVTIKAYKAEQQDEISLDLGESIEVIHKLLDGWWVVR